MNFSRSYRHVAAVVSSVGTLQLEWQLSISAGQTYCSCCIISRSATAGVAAVNISRSYSRKGKFSYSLPEPRNKVKTHAELSIIIGATYSATNLKRRMEEIG